MKKIVEELQKFTPEQLSFEYLGDYVKNIEIADCQVEGLLPPVDAGGSYSRNMLLMKPLEIALLHWPPGVESAIHHHRGFYGYVYVVQGACENIEYTLANGILREHSIMRALPGGTLDEPDGVIHKIKNPSLTETLVTIHFYYPALENLDGLALYDIETNSVGVLNEKAESASFTEPPEHFQSLIKNAFEYDAGADSDASPTHCMLTVVPKPNSEEIRQMLANYYKEQSRQYDHFDLQHGSRAKYIQRINQLIADRIKDKGGIEHSLAIACGTGRRAVRIRELSNSYYPISCVDLSEEMCSQATERGISTYVGAWLDVIIPDAHFDLVSFLYAFGHIPTHAERLASLRKIYAKMKTGGYLFFDVFNVNDKNEWGPAAVLNFENKKLAQFGYERGDVFYQKKGGQAIAFLHYFEESEVLQLLKEAGFSVLHIDHIGYVYRSGEILEGTDQGAFLVWAKKD